MKYLLDTCVISELIKVKPDQRVTSWLIGIDESNLYISTLTVGEIVKGIGKLPEGRRKEIFIDWMTVDVIERFSNRIIDFDLKAASVWGEIQAKSELAGKTMPSIDSQIAACAMANNLTVVTRNISDMEISGVNLFNPWVD